MKRIVAFLGMTIFASALFCETLKIDVKQKPITGGFADLGKLSYSKKKVVVIDDANYPDAKKKRVAFTNAISQRSETLIILGGDVDLSDGRVSDTDHSYFDTFDKGTHKRKNDDFSFPISSNKTIIGKENARIMFGGLRIDSGKNIVIRNITFYDAHGATEYDTNFVAESKASADALVIWDKKSSIPQDIWIDHCTFTDGMCDDMSRNFNHDGSIDICGGKNVTISWCEFTNHDKVMLVALGDKFTDPKERQITLHHNYFHHVTQRLPRSRGTYMHIYNNVYDDIGVSGNVGYMFGPGIASQYIVEGNYLGSHLGTIVNYFDKSKLEEHTYSNFYASKNSSEITEADVKWDGPEKSKSFISHFVTSLEKMPWRVSYKYDLETWQDALSRVKEEAGSSKAVEITGDKK